MCIYWYNKMGANMSKTMKMNNELNAQITTP